MKNTCVDIKTKGKWSVAKSSLTLDYWAERMVDDKREYHGGITAHCLSCAKIEILTRYGGMVDLRGGTGICKGLLIATQVYYNTKPSKVKGHEE